MKKFMSAAAAAAIAAVVAAGCGQSADPADAGTGADRPSASSNAGAEPNFGNAGANAGSDAGNGREPAGGGGEAGENAGNGGNGTAGQAEAPGPEAENAGTDAGGNAAENGSGNGTDSGTENGSGNGTDDDPEATPASRPLYRMDKAYHIRPIDSAPKKVVLLTFDDGPKEEPLLTRMLDTLDKHKAKAIFFVNGYRIEANPELLKLIKERGQTIGNHSWDHINLKNESAASQREQVSGVNAAVEKLTGEKPKFFRPPFGAGNDALKAYVKEQGMLYMTWSNGSLDWDAKATKKNPELVVKNVLEQVHDGANILMHELPWTADALDKLLTELANKGYGFVDPATIETPAAAGGQRVQ